jgi:hypothetical protein
MMASAPLSLTNSRAFLAFQIWSWAALRARGASQSQHIYWIHINDHLDSGL